MKRILLVNLLYIGDLMFTTPAIRALATAYPEAQIDAIVNRKSAQVLENNPLLHQIIAIDAPPSMDSPVQFFKLIRQLRRNRYDLAICLHGNNERATLITGLCGAKHRGGYAKRQFSWLYDQAIVTESDLHPSDDYLATLEKLGMPRQAHHGLEMWSGEAAIARADALWQEMGLDGQTPVIGINIGGTFPTKRWTLEGFAALSDRLARNGMIPAFLGGPMDVEDVNKVCALTEIPPVVFTGKVSLPELAALVRKFALVVTGDSGPMHITASQHVPVVAIFGPTVWTKYYPYGTKHVIVTSDEPCLKCDKRQCDDIRCMRNLSVDTVYGGVRQLTQECACATIAARS